MTQLYLECLESDSLPQQNHAEIRINPLSANSMVKHNQTVRRQQPTNCLSVFNHSAGLALKGLRHLGESTFFM